MLIIKTTGITRLRAGFVGAFTA